MTLTASRPGGVRPPPDSMRRTSLAAGILYLITFVSIPTLFLYNPVRNDAAFVLGAGSETGVLWGAFAEVVVALAGMGGPPSCVLRHAGRRAAGGGRATGPGPRDRTDVARLCPAGDPAP